VRSTWLPRLLFFAGIGSLLLPAPVLLSTANAADAATVKVPLTQASWFWRGQPGAIGTTGIAPPAQVPNPSVPRGDLAVAGPEAPAAGGLPAGPIAETYLSFDMTEVPVGSTIESFVITLPVDPKGITADPLGASIVACAVRTGWAGGLEASAYGGKPTDGCDVHSPRLKAIHSGDGFTVDIAEIAQHWVKPNALNLGIAITDNPANNTTIYQVVFGPKAALSDLTASVTFVPPAEAVEPGTTSPPQAVSPPGNPDHADAAPVITFSPLPPGMPAEVAAPPAPAIAPSVPAIALTTASDPSSPPLGFWIALVMIVLLLGTTTFVLADPRTAVAFRPDRGIAKALRSRLTLLHR
jgi:hypothetical protein